MTSNPWRTTALSFPVGADEDGEAVRLFLEGFSNEDFKDGYKAFLEKRAPKFTFK